MRKIKAEFDETYGPSWHVFVGKHFGSKVTHDSKAFAFFYLEASMDPDGGRIGGCLSAREPITKNARIRAGQGSVDIQVWLDMRLGQRTFVEKLGACIRLRPPIQREMLLR